MNYGERIKELRQNKDYTQKQLADKLFVTDKTISSWEANRTEPSLDMIIKLSEILECNISYLMYGSNNQDNIEMEVKIKLSQEDYNYLKNLLKQKAKLLFEINQQDTYYKLDNDCSLRIRDNGHKSYITYKNYTKRTYSNEYEVEIDNSDNLEKIFTAIGLTKKVIVKKNRVSYQYLDRYEISLDNVDKLGYFIEIEIKDHLNDYLEEYSELLRICQKLGLNEKNIILKRYPELMMEVL